MASTYKLGEFIEKLNRPNDELQYGIDDVCGITNTKELMLGTRANLNGRTFEKFTILEPREFIFNRRTSRNGEKISLGYNTTERAWILTEDYCHFRVKPEAEAQLDPDYLYLCFLNPEFDRYVRFNSWGSATEFFNWDDMVRVPISLPSLPEQKKRVASYRSVSKRIEEMNRFVQYLERLGSTLYRNTVEANCPNTKLRDALVIKEKSKIQVGEADTHGTYPFFTSGKTVLRDSHVLTDGESLFINTGGSFDVKYYCGQASYSTDVLAVQSKTRLAAYLYLFLKDNQGVISERYFQGSALKHLQRDEFLDMEVYIPSQENDLRVEQIRAIFDEISICNRQIRYLEKLKSILIAQAQREVK